jgi:hypothetical protein
LDGSRRVESCPSLYKTPVANPPPITNIGAITEKSKVPDVLKYANASTKTLFALCRIIAGIIEFARTVTIPKINPPDSA